MLPCVMTRQTAVKMFKAVTYAGVYGGLLMPLTFIPVVIFPFVFSKLVAFQILVGLTFPAYLALAWMEPKFRPPKSVLYTAIAAYFAALFLSTIFSVDPVRSWWGNQERMNGLFTLLHFFAWLSMAVGLLKRWSGWRRLLNYEIVLSVIMAVVAILQKPFPRILVFQASDRVGGLLDNPIYMGVYQIFNLSFLALLFLKTKHRTARIIYALAASIDLIAFFLTQSRGAFFGLAAVVGTFTLYYAIFTGSRKARFGILGVGAGFFVLYVLAYMYRASEFILQNAVLSRLTNLQATTATRLIAWDIAWKGFLERPLTGWGFDAFHILFNLKYNPRSLEFGYYETWFDRAHNTIMDVISMTGIFGLLSYLAIFACIFALVWKARKRGWIDLPIAAILTALPVGYFLQNLFVFDHPAAFSMSYLLFALVIAATRPGFMSEEGQEDAGPRKTHAPPFTAFCVLQIVMLVVCWRFSALPFRASAMTIDANNLMLAGRFDEGFDLLKRAGEIHTPYLDEQTFLLSRNMLSIQQQGALAPYPRWQEMYAYAKEITEKHLKDHPRNTHPLFVYARLVHGLIPIQPEETRAEEIALAEELYLRAIETSPKRQQIAFGLARLYSETGRSDQAYDLLKRTVSYDENVGEALWYLGLISWFELGKEEEGTTDLIRAVDAKAPFALQSVQDAWQLAQAALIREDTETLKSIIPILPSLGGGSVNLYLQIARVMEQADLLEQRNSILNALLRIDETLAPKLEGLRTGAVNTIDESFMLVADQVPGEENASENAPADPETNVLSSEPGSQTSTQPASEPGGAGPRR
jgi:O-antigen ligase/tetratricopeptide (TPR) repeat protein